jgi:hypothetical protein
LDYVNDFFEPIEYSGIFSFNIKMFKLEPFFQRLFVLFYNSSKFSTFFFDEQK